MVLRAVQDMFKNSQGNTETGQDYGIKSSGCSHSSEIVHIVEPVGQASPPNIHGVKVGPAEREAERIKAALAFMLGTFKFGRISVQRGATGLGFTSSPL